MSPRITGFLSIWVVNTHMIKHKKYLKPVFGILWWTSLNKHVFIWHISNQSRKGLFGEYEKLHWEENKKPTLSLPTILIISFFSHIFPRRTVFHSIYLESCSSLCTSMLNRKTNMLNSCVYLIKLLLMWNTRQKNDVLAFVYYSPVHTTQAHSSALNHGPVLFPFIQCVIHSDGFSSHPQQVFMCFGFGEHMHCPALSLLNIRCQLLFDRPFF